MATPSGLMSVIEGLTMAMEASFAERDGDDMLQGGLVLRQAEAVKRVSFSADVGGDREVEGLQQAVVCFEREAMRKGWQAMEEGSRIAQDQRGSDRTAAYGKQGRAAPCKEERDLASTKLLSAGDGERREGHRE